VPDGADPLLISHDSDTRPIRTGPQSEEAQGRVQGNLARARWEGVKGDYYPGLAFNIRSITSAPVVMTGRSSCR
jgi:hypothetical protein